MKKLSKVFLAILGIICFSQISYSQDRESHEPTIEINIVETNKKITRYNYKKSSNEWTESELSPIKGYGKVSYKGVDYIAIVLSSRIGWYKYPNIKKDWVSVYLDGYALFTPDQFDNIVPSDDNEIRLSPSIYFSVWGEILKIKPLDKAAKFAFERTIDSGGSLSKFHGDIDNNQTINKNDILFCIKSWKDVIRFDTPLSDAHKDHHVENFYETQLETSYYEVPVAEFIKYIDKIKNFDIAAIQNSSNESPSKKSSKKKK